METPRIYVASLTDYNNGLLHGKWIDADDADNIREEVQEIMDTSPTAKKSGVIAEEWAIHDYDGFCGVEISEYEDFDAVAELAEILKEHGEAFVAYVNCFGPFDEYGSEVGNFEESYCGEWDSEEAYAEDLMEECYEIPDYLESYIDYEKFARDLFMTDYIFEDGHVFRRI